MVAGVAGPGRGPPSVCKGLVACAPLWGRVGRLPFGAVPGQAFEGVKGLFVRVWGGRLVVYGRVFWVHGFFLMPGVRLYARVGYRCCCGMGHARRGGLGCGVTYPPAVRCSVGRGKICPVYGGGRRFVFGGLRSYVREEGTGFVCCRYCFTRFFSHTTMLVLGCPGILERPVTGPLVECKGGGLGPIVWANLPPGLV